MFFDWPLFVTFRNFSRQRFMERGIKNCLEARPLGPETGQGICDLARESRRRKGKNVAHAQLLKLFEFTVRPYLHYGPKVNLLL